MADGDDIERFEEERELELYREYRDVVGMFAYVVETERRFYLANDVSIERTPDGWAWWETCMGELGEGSAKDAAARLVKGESTLDFLAKAKTLEA